MSPVVIIGAIAAGMSAASQIKRQMPQADVLVFGDEKYPSYGACGMPLYLAGEISDYQKLIALKPYEIKEIRKIDLRLFHKVLSIDKKNKSVTVQDLTSNQTFTQQYEKLVIATGSQSIKPNLPGSNLGGIFTLKTLDDAIAINDFIKGKKPRKAAIIGAGFIGIEVAESFVKRGMQVDLIEAAPRILSVMDEEMSLLTSKELEKNNVTLWVNEKVSGFEGSPSVKKVLLESGKTIESELVLLSIGVLPNTALAKDAGIELGERGAILTDLYQKTSVSDIFAAGDCSTIFHNLLKKPVYIPLALGANRQGRLCGENISAELNHQSLKPFPGIIGTSMTKCFNLEIGKTGLGESEISRNSLEGIRSTSIEYVAKAGYYPEHSKIWVKLFYDTVTHIIVGGQIVGQNGSVLRLDVLSAAISQKMTLENLYELDMGYCPPFSPVWDPLLVASRSALKEH